jgi:hypothetical protein
MRGRILKIRPGPLANFSGGAGYMPFIVFLSVPASALFWLVSSVILYSKARPSGDPPALADAHEEQVPLVAIASQASKHLSICFVIAAVAGALFLVMGLRMVYSNEARYVGMAACLALGPVISWFVSTVVLVRLGGAHGPRGRNLAYSAGVFVALLAFFLLVGGTSN